MAGHLPSMPKLWFRFPALLKKIRGGGREGGRKREGWKEREGSRQEEAMEELEIWFSG